MNKSQAMQVFVRVVETGGMTRAADSLQMPKATATTLIQQLEADLGVKLLNRTTRSISVTTDGAAYYPRCVAILAQIRETEESLAHRHAAPGGPLRVDAPTLIARMVIVPALLPFSRAIRASIWHWGAANAAPTSLRKESTARCGAASSKTRL